MKYIIIVISAMLVFSNVHTQTDDQWRMIGSIDNNGWTVVDDSTYTGNVNFQSDLTGKSFLASGIQAGYRVFTQTSQMYRIDVVTSTTFSSAQITIIEYGADRGTPIGQVTAFDPQGRETVPAIPFGSTGSTAALQAAVVTWNAKDTVSFSSEFDGTGSIGDPITLAQQSASTGQGLVWDGSMWAPSNLLSLGEVQTEIGDSLFNYSTSTEVSQEISDSLFNYSTSTEISQEISDSLGADNWLKPELEGGSDVSIVALNNNLNISTKSISNNTTNTTTSATRALILGSSNFVAGENNMTHGSSNILGYNSDFSTPNATNATNNFVVGSTGSYILELSSYNSLLSSRTTRVLDASFNTALSTTETVIQGITGSVSIGRHIRPYQSYQLLYGSSLAGFGGADIENAGTSQETKLTVTTRYAVNAAAPTINVATITLDTMPKTYLIEVYASQNVSEAGDGSLPVGEQHFEKFYFSAVSDGSTATLGADGKQTLYTDQTSNVFTGQSFIISDGGNTISIFANIGSGAGSVSSPTVAHCRVNYTIQELSYVDY